MTSRGLAAPLAAAALAALLGCGIKAPPRPPLPARPGGAAPAAAAPGAPACPACTDSPPADAAKEARP